MQTRNYFFTIQQVKDSMPEVSPTMLDEEVNDWGIWMDTEAQELNKSLPHPFVVVTAKSGKQWYGQVVPSQMQKEFASGAKYEYDKVPDKQVDDQIQQWLDAHAGQHSENPEYRAEQAGGQDTSPSESQPESDPFHKEEEEDPFGWDD